MCPPVYLPLAHAAMRRPVHVYPSPVEDTSAASVGRVGVFHDLILEDASVEHVAGIHYRRRLHLTIPFVKHEKVSEHVIESRVPLFDRHRHLSVSSVVVFPTSYRV